MLVELKLLKRQDLVKLDFVFTILINLFTGWCDLQFHEASS